VAAVLLDEDVPVKLRQYFRDDWTVHTVAYRGWKGRRNSELLARARDEFDVLVTLDTSIEHQQNLGRYGLALLVLRGRTDRLEDLIPLMPRVNRLLPDLESGQVVEVSA
jgi:hypothetical protein